MRRRIALLVAAVFAVCALSPVSAFASASQATVTNVCGQIYGVPAVISTVNYAGTGIANGTLVTEYNPGWSQYVRSGSYTWIMRSRPIDHTAHVVNGIATFTVAASQIPSTVSGGTLITGSPFEFGLVTTNAATNDVVWVPYQTMATVCT